MCSPDLKKIIAENYSRKIRLRIHESEFLQPNLISFKIPSNARAHEFTPQSFFGTLKGQCLRDTRSTLRQPPIRAQAFTRLRSGSFLGKPSGERLLVYKPNDPFLTDPHMILDEPAARRCCRDSCMVSTRNCETILYMRKSEAAIQQPPLPQSKNMLPSSA